MLASCLWGPWLSLAGPYMYPCAKAGRDAGEHYRLAPTGGEATRRIEDILAQTVASLLNLSARRIVKDDEVDLDQARTGIEAVRVLRDLLPPEVAEAVQEPLSQVQLLYAQRAGTQEGEPGQGDAASGDAAPGGAPGAGAPAAEQEPPQQQRPPGPKLWTPGRD